MKLLFFPFRLLGSMRAVYLRSVKSPLVQPNKFVFRPPAQKVMNHSDIYSQAVVEQDSNYAIDSFCVDSDEVEESALGEDDDEESMMLPTSHRPAPPILDRRERRQQRPNNAPVARSNGSNGGRSRKRIICPTESSDSETSPPKVPAAKVAPTSAVPAAVPSCSTWPVHNVSSSSSTPPSFSMSREERLERQRQKQEEFRRTVMVAKDNVGTATSSSVPLSDRSTAGALLVGVSSAAAAAAHRTNPSGGSSSTRVLISSRQVSTAGQVISTLQVKFQCATHVCSFNVADFVVSPQLGVLRKMHSGEHHPLFLSLSRSSFPSAIVIVRVSIRDRGISRRRRRRRVWVAAVVVVGAAGTFPWLSSRALYCALSCADSALHY